MFGEIKMFKKEKIWKSKKFYMKLYNIVYRVSAHVIYLIRDAYRYRILQFDE